LAESIKPFINRRVEPVLFPIYVTKHGLGTEGSQSGAILSALNVIAAFPNSSRLPLLLSLLQQAGEFEITAGRLATLSMVQAILCSLAGLYKHEYKNIVSEKAAMIPQGLSGNTAKCWSLHKHRLRCGMRRLALVLINAIQRSFLFPSLHSDVKLEKPTQEQFRAHMLGRDLLDADWLALNDTSTPRQHLTTLPLPRPRPSSSLHKSTGFDQHRQYQITCCSRHLGQARPNLSNSSNGDLIVTTLDFHRRWCGWRG
jgi:hypothetical protein